MADAWQTLLQVVIVLGSIRVNILPVCFAMVVRVTICFVRPQQDKMVSAQSLALCVLLFSVAKAKDVEIVTNDEGHMTVVGKPILKSPNGQILPWRHCADSHCMFLLPRGNCVPIPSLVHETFECGLPFRLFVSLPFPLHHLPIMSSRRASTLADITKLTTTCRK